MPARTRLEMGAAECRACMCGIHAQAGRTTRAANPTRKRTDANDAKARIDANV